MAERSGQKFLRVPTTAQLSRRLQLIADQRKQSGRTPSIRSLALELIERGLQEIEDRH
ncbi:hypothetical protein Plim_4302 (plasmid) [Planctopirus limnophila DSM 3776]|uniref:Uncharacterized protein n=1 Tax=Planctopirus limnophila (strain ATCC 43296 / DSM 3776 / IFAM 1008 / Mu 290) TaxID=521674 RepID=D5SZI9_PLAL2|nr:hypothetical protein [Planctopirus limnophila]ADG70109.1 hypothetical protein Plim_4302 [Planctopirus limnophila DSM 3776]